MFIEAEKAVLIFQHLLDFVLHCIKGKNDRRKKSVVSEEKPVPEEQLIIPQILTESKNIRLEEDLAMPFCEDLEEQEQNDL